MSQAKGDPSPKEDTIHVKEIEDRATTRERKVGRRGRSK
jgi:hypothetical protein